MIDETYLSTLGSDDPGGSSPQFACRPVGEVMVRGAQLRRRRRAVRSAGVGTILAGGLAATNVFVVGRGPADKDHVSTAESTETPTTPDVTSPPPSTSGECDDPVDGLADTLDVSLESPPEPLTPAEVPDEMRLLPTWAPDGEEVVGTVGSDAVAVLSCEGRSTPLETVLHLVAADGDGVVRASIDVTGPMGVPMHEIRGPDLYVPAELRGGPAFIAIVPEGTDGVDEVSFSWTEPDGWSWSISGYGLGAGGEASVRAVAEALALDSSPEGDEALAGLDPADMPAGFEVVLQTKGVPDPPPVDPVTWTVTVGEATTDERSSFCTLRVERWGADSPLVPLAIGSGPAPDINGKPAIFSSSALAGPAWTTLTWEVAPDTMATADCAIWGDGLPRAHSRETLVQFAESVVPVDADDPRLSR